MSLNADFLAPVQVGDWAYATAVAVWAYDVGGPQAVGVWVAIRLGLSAVLAPFGASLADKMDRRRLMLLTDLVRAAEQHGIPVTEVARRALEDLVGDVPHQGIVAAVAAFAYTELEALLEHRLSVLVVTADERDEAELPEAPHDSPVGAQAADEGERGLVVRVPGGGEGHLGSGLRSGLRQRGHPRSRPDRTAGSGWRCSG